MYLFKVYIDYGHDYCDNDLKEIVKELYTTFNNMNAMSFDQRKFFGPKKSNTPHTFGYYNNDPHGIVRGIISEGFTKERLEENHVFSKNKKTGLLMDCMISDMIESKYSKVAIYRSVICPKDKKVKFSYVVKKIPGRHSIPRTREIYSEFNWKTTKFINSMRDTDQNNMAIEVNFI